MKKTLFISALAIACTIALHPGSAYASLHKEGKDPDSKTIKALHEDFPQARKITWAKDRKNFIARFDAGARKITAVYNKEGHLASTLIVCEAGYIPFNFQTKLAKEYPDYTLRLMKKRIVKENCSYYFILENQQGNIVSYILA